MVEGTLMQWLVGAVFIGVVLVIFLLAGWLDFRE